MSKSIDNILELIIDKCRICLEHHGSINILNSPDLVNDIKLSTTIEVKKEDEFPKNICISCKRHIKIAVDIRKKAKSTNSRLIFIRGSDQKTQLQKIDGKPGTPSVVSKVKNGPHKTRKIKQGEDLFEFPVDEIKQRFENNIRKSSRLKRDAVPSVARQKASKVKCIPLKKRKVNHEEENTKKIHPNINKNRKKSNAIDATTAICNSESSRIEENDDEKENNSSKTIVSSTKGDNIKNRDNINSNKLIVSSCSSTKGDDIKNRDNINSNKLIVSSYGSTKGDDIKDGSKGAFVCSTCDRTCPSRSSLFLHTRTHDKSRQFLCPLCEKFFTSRSDLNKHSRVHTGEKPFECDICNKRFSQNSTLKSHRVLHSRGQRMKKKNDKWKNRMMNEFEMNLKPTRLSL